MKIDSQVTYIKLEDGSWANQLMFFTNGIKREVLDKIINYVNALFSTCPHAYGFFDAEILRNVIFITTNRGSTYLSQVFRNIERIANNEETIPLTTLTEDILKEYERDVKTMDNRFSRTQFDCGTNNINNFQIDVYFGSSKEEEINRIIFVEYVKDAFAKIADSYKSYKKKSINTSVTNKYGIVKITVSGFQAKDYTDLVKSVQTRMNDIGLNFDMDDIINLNTGKISVNRKKMVDKKFSALDDKVLDCLDCLDCLEDYLGKHEDPLLEKLQAIQFDITELWTMIIDGGYLDEHKE